MNLKINPRAEINDDKIKKAEERALLPFCADTPSENPPLRFHPL